MTLASAAFAGQAKVYVANEDDSTITVVDAATFKTVANSPVGQKPHNVQVGPDGKVAWVTNDSPSKIGEMRTHSLRTMSKMRARVQANCGESPRKRIK